MKFSRILSTVCASCLALALALPAGAANITPVTTSDTQLSEHAGTVMKCQVVVAGGGENGEDLSYAIDVPIPANATKAQADQLLMSAVQPNATASARIGEVFDTISVKNNLPYIVAPTYWDVGGGTFEMDYNTLVTVFYNPFFGNGASELIARVSNITTGVTATQSTSTNVAYTAYVYIIPSRPGSNNITFQSGETIEVEASVDTGWMDAESCEIWATVTQYT